MKSISIVFIEYEIIIANQEKVVSWANSTPSVSLAIYHLISKALSWNNC